jgi:hypothetical protein
VGDAAGSEVAASRRQRGRRQGRGGRRARGMERKRVTCATAHNLSLSANKVSTTLDLFGCSKVAISFSRAQSWFQISSCSSFSKTYYFRGEMEMYQSMSINQSPQPTFPT